MGESNFMTAGTEIDGVISKYEQCMNKISTLVASACIGRSKKGNINDGLKNDIMNLIKDLPTEDQNKVLLSTVVELTKALSSPSQPSSNRNNRNDMSSIFSSRGF